MIIKKFQGKTENDAVETAKKELGNNVVIMNVKNVKKKGILRFFLPDTVEVTVALEEENEKYAPVRREAVPAASMGGGFAPKRDSLSREGYADAPEGSDFGRQGYATGQQGGSPVLEGYPGRTAAGPEMSEKRRESAFLEEKLNNLHSLLEQQLQKPEEEEEGEEPASELEKFMKLLYNTMLDNEISEKYANQIIDEIEKSAKPNMPFDYALANIYQKMILKFGKQEGITPSESGPKAVFFIGPTGVGKTTTIAKIASRFIVDEKKKVALITSDTYRIAAAEQLRTYAGILEVPFRIVYTPEEIRDTLRDFVDYDYIFVDTSGHSYQNEEQKETMKTIVHSVDGEAEKEVFLVLSATTKYKDLLRIVDAYTEVTEYKLIFTKLDETNAYGNLLNIKLYTGAALSYVTYGQNVPDDLEDFNPQRTVKQLLGGR